MKTTEAHIAGHTGSLADISEVKPFSSEDKMCLDEIREVLRKHNALTRFGVTLLHSHFPLEPDEVLVEETDVQNRRQTIFPVKRNEIPKEATLTNWRFDTHEACPPLCRIIMQYC